jgi:MFS family permease
VGDKTWAADTLRLARMTLSISKRPYHRRLPGVVVEASPPAYRRNREPSPERKRLANRLLLTLHRTPKSDRFVLRLYPSLRGRVYRRLWLGVVPYHFAFQLGVVTTGYAAISVAASTFEIGLIVGAWGLPVLFLPPVGGVAAVRFSRRRTMVICQAVLLSVTVVVIALALSGVLSSIHLIVLGLVQGSTYSFYAPARTAYTAAAVEPPLVHNAIAAYILSDYASAVVGPLLGGIILAIWGDAVAGYVVMAAIYTIVLVIFWGLPEQDPPLAGAGIGVRAPIWAAIQQVGRSSALTKVFLVAALATLLGMPFQQLMPIFADQVFMVGAAGLGVLLTAVGVGAVLGSVLAARIPQARLQAWQAPLAAALGSAVVAFALTPTFPAACLPAAIAGMSGSGLAVVNYSLMLMRTRPDLYGRTASLFQMTFALAPIGAIPMAAIADSVGAEATVIVAGLLLIGAALTIGVGGRGRPSFASDAEAREGQVSGRGSESEAHIP